MAYCCRAFGRKHHWLADAPELRSASRAASSSARHRLLVLTMHPVLHLRDVDQRHPGRRSKAKVVNIATRGVVFPVSRLRSDAMAACDSAVNTTRRSARRPCRLSPSGVTVDSWRHEWLWTALPGLPNVLAASLTARHRSMKFRTDLVTRPIRSGGHFQGTAVANGQPGGFAVAPTTLK